MLKSVIIVKSTPQQKIGLICYNSIFENQKTYYYEEYLINTICYPADFYYSTRARWGKGEVAFSK
jgi:hypothetical protein